MENVNLYVSNFGSRRTSSDWPLRYPTKLQRLYYIKGGAGRYMQADGSCSDFVPGMVYLFPYNLRAHFINSPDDPIDHLYIDFISTPPIIAPEPIRYDAPANGKIAAVISLLEETIHPFMKFEPFDAYIDHILSARSGSVGEQKQIIYQLFKALLMILSAQREIPFSSDVAICETLEFIRKNYSKRITLGDLAQIANFEETYFIHRFKSVMGQTPYAYLKTYRLMRAQELLFNGAKLSTAAGMVGYENASSLSRALKQYHTVV